MFLSKLSIKNFRGISQSEFRLTEHFILLGNNNSGKSTIIDAIGLLLGKETLVKNLGDWDFFGGDPKPTDRIKITGVLTEFLHNDPSKCKEWFNDVNGGIPLWLDSATGAVYNEQNDAKTLKLCVEISFAARFNKDDFEFETIRYFSAGVDDPFEEEALVTMRRDLGRQIGFFLIPSRRNWERIISFNSEIFRKVVEFQEAVPAQNLFQIRNDLRDNPHGIEKENPFKEIVDRINSEIKGFSGKEMALSFLPTNGDIESTKNSITPFLLGRGSVKIPLGYHGSGLISLQTLLLLLEFGRFRKEKNQNFILAAEEPELHMHPGMHRRLIARIRGLSTQTIISTHSPEIAAYYKPTEINIVETSETGVTTVSPLLESQTPPENALMKLFTIYRKETSEAVMNSKIVIPEGISEYHWLNKLTNAFITTEGWDVTDAITPFGILPTQDSNVVQTYKAINRFNSLLIPFVDGDSAGNGYVKALKLLEKPPKVILQLKDRHFLEHLIAWLVLPQDDSDNAKLKSVLGSDIDFFDIEGLGTLLESAFKTYWKIHDELIELIIENAAYTAKVKTLISAFDEIGNEGSAGNKYWIKNQGSSNVSTTVLTLNIY
jgi:putative ATP-dependent endonuclease of OLD family